MICDGVTGLPAGYQRHHKAGEPACSACRKGWAAKNRAWARNNPESVRATKRKTRPKESARRRALLAADPERYRALRRAWDKSSQREHVRRYRARKRDAVVVPFTTDQLAQRMRYWGERCWICTGAFEEVDHVKALARGGPHMLANLRPICKSCNSRKADRPVSRCGMFLEVA